MLYCKEQPLFLFRVGGGSRVCLEAELFGVLCSCSALHSRVLFLAKDQMYLASSISINCQKQSSKRGPGRYIQNCSHLCNADAKKANANPGCTGVHAVHQTQVATKEIKFQEKSTRLINTIYEERVANNGIGLVSNREAA